MKKSGSYDFLKNSIEMLESYFLLDHTDDKRERVFKFELSAANYNVTFYVYLKILRNGKMEKLRNWCYFIFEFDDKKLYFRYNLSNFVRLLAALVSILLDNMLVGGIYEFSKI